MKKHLNFGGFCIVINSSFASMAMSFENNTITIPSYTSFDDAIAVLKLPISGSELHGMMCGYLCAGAFEEGEMYLRALMIKQEKNEELRVAARALFDLYGLSKTQLHALDFEFKLLLPDDETPLLDRASAFAEWCEGFTQAMTLSGVYAESLDDEEAEEILQHLCEFAELDYDSLAVSEEDEQAFAEVSEYARMAILRLSGDVNTKKSGRNDTTH
jgi:uncharacterized protein YgfB (UPF0149 family)